MGTELTHIQGELQLQLMPILWRLERATVDQARAALPKRHRSAYTTVQTVLNRMAERGLLTRDRDGNAIVYRPAISETEYLSRSIEQTLAGASSDARQAVLAQLVGSLGKAELSELQSLAGEIAKKRGEQ